MALNLFIRPPFRDWKTRTAYGDAYDDDTPAFLGTGNELAEIILLETSNANVPIYAACTGLLSTRYLREQ